jgi:putative oxidoreductase
LTVSYGLLLIRIVFGLTLAAHGGQKLFGWFGGGGPNGTAGMFEKLEFRWPMAMAVLAGLSEFGGGVLLAAGLLTPLAAFALTVVMLVAIATVHWSKGFWSTGGGYEFNLAIMAAAIAIAATGPGRFSLDNAFGWTGGLSGVWWGVGVAAAAAVAALLNLTFGRTHTLHAGPATSSR